MEVAPVTAELLQRHDRPGPRYTSYPTAVEFSDAVGPREARAALKQAARVDAPLSVYVHLPFCEHRCLYCACNVIISPNHEVAAPYLGRLSREIGMLSDPLGARTRVAQFHLGGGTPTYLTPEQLGTLMARFRESFRFEPDAEIAVEVDPRVTTNGQVDQLVSDGFNRYSLGVQDFDPRVQERVERIQSVEITRALMEKIRSRGRFSINIDLIYGLPHQTPESFRETLARVVELRPERLAVYSFAFVPWMKGHQKYLREEELPAGAGKFRLLATAREVLLGAGWVDIGMDHFALPDDELAVAQREGRLWRNFMGYTTARAADMLGLGISSIGYLAGTYVQNHKKLSDYDRAVDAGELPVERGIVLSTDDLLRADVIRELMCNFVVRYDDIGWRHGVEFREVFAGELQELRKLEHEGFVDLFPDEIRVVGHGRLFVRNVAMVFDRYLREKARPRPTFSRTV